MGSILAAINPYVLIPSLYDEKCMDLYANMATDAGAPPHPYELMELAYRCVAGGVDIVGGGGDDGGGSVSAQNLCAPSGR